MTAEPISSEYQVPLTALANNPVLSESNYDMFAYEWKHDDSCALPCDRSKIFLIAQVLALDKQTKFSELKQKFSYSCS